LQPFQPAQHCREHTTFLLLSVRTFWWILVGIRGYRKIIMQIPLQVTFEGSDPSAAVRAAIEREVERLETHNRDIIGCRVAVIAPSQKHRHGSGFNVHISLTVPPHESVIVNHEPSDGKRYAHEHIEVAVKDAFAAARRQLDDLA
jgi:ribosome-associated translation inhibitor RaiA